MISIAEQLAEVELLIADFRWARDKDARVTPERKTYDVLKIVAAHLRARLPGATEEALSALDRRFGDLEKTRAMLGVEVGVAQEMIGRWPVIRHALEMACTNGEEETRG